MLTNPYIGHCFVGRRFLNGHRIYRVLGTYVPGSTAQPVYRCETLSYKGDNTVSVEYDYIDVTMAGDFLIQEITTEQYMRGIDLFYQSLVQIRHFITSMKSTACDHIEIGKAYRLFDVLYYDIRLLPQDKFLECKLMNVKPTSISLNNSWVPPSLSLSNRIDYEEIDVIDAQKAVKQFQLLYATVRSYINALVKEDPAYPPFQINSNK